MENTPSDFIRDVMAADFHLRAGGGLVAAQGDVLAVIVGGSGLGPTAGAHDADDVAARGEIGEVVDAVGIGGGSGIGGGEGAGVV